MGSTIEQQWQFAQRLEKELTTSLKVKDTPLGDIEHLIQELRSACEAVILLNIDYATSHKVEARLWDAHVLINNRYRKIVARNKSEEQRRLAVEKRKWEKRYVDFLKTSQYFYKGFVQRLASHYDILELRKIAHSLQLSTLSVNPPINVSEESRKRILLSCHTSLLRLGDLSRYRNVLRTKDRSFDTALAYYGLANDLFPDAGSAFNQMAVISLQDGDHLHAVYYLYRALSAIEPNTMAQGNLTTEFKKVTLEWTQGSKKVLSRSSLIPLKTGVGSPPLVSWFVRLHAKLYKGEEFSEHDELENEVLSQLTVLLKEQSLEGVLDKIVLINIAAEYCAGERLKEVGQNALKHHFQSYYFLLRLNVRMLFMLLQLLQPELVGPSRMHTSIDTTDHTNNATTESITAVTRRVLPALRQYSIWLVSRADIIVAQEGNAHLNIHIKEMWSTYCSALTSLVAMFPPGNLPTVEYLMEEDAATVGFKPFRESPSCKLYTDDHGLKPRTTDPGVERNHPNIEMLVRVRDLLTDGVVLAVDQRYPIEVINSEFRFVEEDLPLSNPMRGSSPIHSMTSMEAPQGTTAAYTAPTTAQFGHNVLPRVGSVAQSDSHQSMSTDMHRMVDDLLTPLTASKNDYSHGSNETSYGMDSLTAAEVFATPDRDERPHSRHHIAPLPLPFVLGPTICADSPFSPQPGELLASKSGTPMASLRLSDLQLSNRKQRSEAASSLEQSTTRNGRRLSVWESRMSASPTSSLQPQIMGQNLHNSLAEQYAPSSMFSNTSSVYAGTPYGQQQAKESYSAVWGNLPVNESTDYGTTGFGTSAMLQSSLWDGSQPAYSGSFPTPPGGQGG